MINPYEISPFYGQARALSDFSASSPAGAANRSSVEALELRVDRQNLLIQTLLIVLLEKKIFDEAEFKRWRDYADNLDGRADGKLRESATPVSCPKCQRNNPPTASQCVYCGEPFEAPAADPRYKPS
jgi:hypothetical protein